MMEGTKKTFTTVKPDNMEVGQICLVRIIQEKVGENQANQIVIFTA